MMNITAKEIEKAVRCRFSRVGTLAKPNVFLKNSPWEADLIIVTKAYYYTEFEIKLSVADFRKDFQKTLGQYFKDGPLKHDLYSSPGPIELDRQQGRGWWNKIPKPKQFYFAVPVGLLKGIEIPRHCGLLEIDEQKRLTITKRAPRLSSPTKLSQAAIFNLALKTRCQKCRS